MGNSKPIIKYITLSIRIIIWLVPMESCLDEVGKGDDDTAQTQRLKWVLIYHVISDL